MARSLVLVVDDNLAMAENIGEILEGAGYATTLAGSATSALQRTDRDTQGLAAIVTDFRMPGGSGAQLITALRQRGCHAPALVVSAFLDPEAFLAARAAGALEILLKPLDVAHFLSLMRRAVPCPLDAR